MDEIHLSMVAICDRLLLLMTGKTPLEGIDQEAALEAIELLMKLEGWLKNDASATLSPLVEEALTQITHRVHVLQHVQPVTDLLTAQGWLPIAFPA